MPSLAQAHAILEQSTPAAGASVRSGPLDLRLRYNSRIDRARSRLTLIRPLGFGRVDIAAGTARIAGYAALVLLLSEVATVALQGAVLIDTVDLSLREVLTAQFAVAGLVKTVAAAPIRHAPLVFPLLCAAGGTMMLTHSQAIANVKDQVLIELTHTPLALAGIAAGWARWREIQLNPGENPVVWQIAGWVWPVCILFRGLLLGYREA